MSEHTAPRVAESSRGVRIEGVEVDGVILDLDGVITRTARVHARAWKRMFDDFLERRAERSGEPFEPFSIDEDYRRYVDGKPRYDGVRSFLESRGIELPEGDPEDGVQEKTVCGLGNRKNDLFRGLIAEGGVEVFDDAVRMIRLWRSRGLKTAVVSSSKNCQAVLRGAHLESLFDARVDGRDAEERELPGKPAPDLFLEAAEELGLAPARAVVVEDAAAGVEAGRAGGFGLVVGVARDADPGLLQRHGAHVVVRALDELHTEAAAGAGDEGGLPSAIDAFDRIARRLADKRPAVFLDYDGTLTPIVRDPAEARLSPPMRRAVQRLAGAIPVAVVSGRDRGDVESLVQLESLIYAGSHGFDIRGPELRHEHEGGVAVLGDLEDVERQLRARLESIRGAQVERKRFAVAVHYRNVDDAAVEGVESAVDAVHAAHAKLRKRGGKKIFELQPDIPWDKGRAVLWLLETLDLDRPDVLPMYLGDDLTDEDAFRALAGRGLGIVVGDFAPPTAADFRLRDVGEVQVFLERLTDLAEEKRP